MSRRAFPLAALLASPFGVARPAAGSAESERPRPIAMLLSRTLLKRRSALPGIHLALGFTLLHVGLIVLLPLSAAFLKTATMTWPASMRSPRRACWRRTG